MCYIIGNQSLDMNYTRVVSPQWFNSSWTFEAYGDADPNQYSSDYDVLPVGTKPINWTYMYVDLSLKVSCGINLCAISQKNIRQWINKKIIVIYGRLIIYI